MKNLLFSFTDKFKTTLRIIVSVVLALSICTVIIQGVSLNNIKEERDLYYSNMNAALNECITWKTKDSLSAAKNDALTLRIDELQRYREKDLKTISALKKKNEDLNNLVTELSNTKVEIKTEVRDSIIYVDSSKLNAKVFKWSDNWVDVNGTIVKDSVDIEVSSRDSLVIGVTTEYKRFLGFLWKTKKIKSQKVYAISKNPHTTITNIECVNIK